MSIKMRVTTNGRVTIPKEIRDRLGFVPGTDLDFVIQSEEVSLTKADRKKNKLNRGEEIVARITGSGTANLDLTTDEIMALMRGWDEDDLDLERTLLPTELDASFGKIVSTVKNTHTADLLAGQLLMYSVL